MKASFLLSAVLLLWRVAEAQFVFLDDTMAMSRSPSTGVTILSSEKVGFAFQIPDTKQLAIENFYAAMTVPSSQGNLALNAELYALAASAAKPYLSSGAVPIASTTIFIDATQLLNAGGSYMNIMLPAASGLVAKSSFSRNWAIVFSPASGNQVTWFVPNGSPAPTGDFGCTYLGKVGATFDSSRSLWVWNVAAESAFVSFRGSATFAVDPDWIPPSPSTVPASPSAVPASPSAVAASPSTVPASPSAPAALASTSPAAPSLLPPAANIVFTLSIAGVAQGSLLSSFPSDYTGFLQTLKADVVALVASSTASDQGILLPAGRSDPILIMLPNAAITSTSVPVLVTVSQPVYASYEAARSIAATINSLMSVQATAANMFAATRNLAAQAARTGIPASSVKVSLLAPSLAVSTTNPGAALASFTALPIPSFPSFAFPSLGPLPLAVIEFRLRIQQFTSPSGMTINLPAAIAAGSTARASFELALKNDVIALLAARAGVTGVVASSISITVLGTRGVVVRRRELQLTSPSPSGMPMASPSSLPSRSPWPGASPSSSPYPAAGTYIDVIVKVPVQEAVTGASSTYAALLAGALNTALNGASPSPGTGGSSTGAGISAVLPSAFSSLQQATSPQFFPGYAAFGASVVAPPATVAAASPSPSPMDANSNSSSGGSRAGPAVGGVFGGLVAVAVIFALVMLFVRRSRKRGTIRRLSKNPRRGSVGGAIVVNPVGMGAANGGIMMAPLGYPAAPMAMPVPMQSPQPMPMHMPGSPMMASYPPMPMPMQQQTTFAGAGSPNGAYPNLLAPSAPMSPGPYSPAAAPAYPGGRGPEPTFAPLVNPLQQQQNGLAGPKRPSAARGTSI